jgi:NAD(P)-dependent dehydrogenase (short-subunit alcohol dehydrogenase family)
LKKTGTPADVAKMVAYLCSENASYITGADFLIDGGMTL